MKITTLLVSTTCSFVLSACSFDCIALFTDKCSKCPANEFVGDFKGIWILNSYKVDGIDSFSFFKNENYKYQTIWSNGIKDSVKIYPVNSSNSLQISIFGGRNYDCPLDYWKDKSLSQNQVVRLIHVIDTTVFDVSLNYYDIYLTPNSWNFQTIGNSIFSRKQFWQITNFTKEKNISFVCNANGKTYEYIFESLKERKNRYKN